MIRGKSVRIVAFAVLLCGAMQAQGTSGADELFEQASAATRASDFDKAEFFLREMRSQFPQDLRWGTALIGVLESKGRVGDALKLAQEIRPQHLRDPFYFYQRGRLLVNMDREREAVDDFQTAIRLSDSSGVQGIAYLMMGEAYRQLDELGEAITAFRKAKEITGRATIQLALALDGKGDRAGAVAEYRAVLKQNPNDAVALNNLAYGWAERGENLDEAYSYALRAVSAGPGDSNFVDTLAWVYFQRGMLGDAEQTMVSALLKEGGNHPTLREHLAQVMDARGQWTADRRALRALLNGEPDVDQVVKIRQLLRKMQTPEK
ncbi:MAG: tetratricopeptide repeat protein [Acidobacteriota bacterium]